MIRAHDKNGGRTTIKIRTRVKIRSERGPAHLEAGADLCGSDPREVRQSTPTRSARSVRGSQHRGEARCARAVVAVPRERILDLIERTLACRSRCAPERSAEAAGSRRALRFAL